MENQRRIETDNKLKYDGIWLNDELEWRGSAEYGMTYDDFVKEIAKLRGVLGEFDDYAYDEQRKKDIEQAAKNVQESQIAEENRRLEDEEYQLEQEALEVEEGKPDIETLIAEEMLWEKEVELEGLWEIYNILLGALVSISDDKKAQELLEGQNMDALYYHYNCDLEQFDKVKADYMLWSDLMAQKANIEDK